MNSLQDLIKRLSNIGQVTEAEEKCPECGKVHEGKCDKEILLDKDKVDESKGKKPDFLDVDNDGNKKETMSDALKDKEEKVDEGLGHQILGGAALLAALWGVNNQMANDAYDNSPQLQQLIKLHQDAKASGNIVKAKELQQRIQAQKDRLDLDRGEVVGADGNPVKVKETALNLLRRYAGIQETKIEEEEVEEGGKFGFELKKARDAGKEEFEVDGKKYKVNECGDMSMGGEMSPMSYVSDMASPIQVIGNPEAEHEAPHMEMPMAAEEPKPKYTLNIQNGENNLSMTTDMPDEIIHIMKLAGVNKGAEVTKKSAPDSEQEVEESGYENTPDNTQARDPQAFGDIRDWGKKGTGAGKPNYPGTRASGDNPMSETRMFEDYKNFKAGK